MKYELRVTYYIMFIYLIILLVTILSFKPLKTNYYIYDRHHVSVYKPHTINEIKHNVKAILTSYDLPISLIRLVYIESNFDTLAVSKVGAAGLWQLMPNTARHFGLVVNDSIDERFDYIKSTHAACKYLKLSYKEFKDWDLVVISYNMGIYGLKNKISKFNSSNIEELNLPKETINYYYKFKNN